MKNIINKIIDRYQIIEKIGEGGMAVVYKAIDTRLDSMVAIKFIRVERLTIETMPRALKRFEREAKSLAKLTHPNIVKVTDFGKFEDRPYLVMEYLSGGTLKKRTGKPVDHQAATRIILPIARALEYAHEQNLIHRDVKPSNILLTSQGQPMLSDFGIVKVLEEDVTTELTGTNMAMGTPEYMAPEQVSKVNADHRSDIYSLGIVYYELVTGRKPFQGDTPMSVLFKHATEKLPRPRSINPEILEIVEDILIKALAKDPDQRYLQMSEFAADLEEVISNSGKAPILFSSKGGSEDTNDTILQVDTQDTNVQEATTGRIVMPPAPRKTPKPPAKSNRKEIGLWVVGLLVLGLIFCSGSIALYILSNQGASTAETDVPAQVYTKTRTPTKIPANTSTNEPAAIVISSTSTPRPITLDYCKKSSADICIYSLGILNGQMMITLEVDRSSISGLYIQFSSGNKYTCAILTGYQDRYYCLGPTVKANTNVTMKIYQRSSQLLAQGSITIPSLNITPPKGSGSNYP